MKNSINPSVNVVRVGIVLPEDNLSSIIIYLNNEDQFNISPNAALSENIELHIHAVGSEILINNTPSDQFVISCVNNDHATVTINPVRVGRGFHWEKFVEQKLYGKLHIKIHEGYLFVINEIALEQYITAVVSSEMSPDCPTDFIRAQTIVARSWYLANRGKKHLALGIDVCNDDCCQRYQGFNQVTGKFLKEVLKTSGLVLTFKGEICDARYSKCCGGITESNQNVWKDEPLPYLQSIPDQSSASVNSNTEELDLETWIKNVPDTNCRPHPNQPKDLIQYLGNVDRKIQYYRWNISYTQSELTKIINNKLNLDIRVITKFNINQRGKSGRIVDLIIDYIDAYQKNQELQLTNEYDIRFALHENFLYSSALIIQNGKTVNGIPENFILHGAGWGHGVGLCQIGALNLALKDVIYKSILTHYYPGTILKNLSEI